MADSVNRQLVTLGLKEAAPAVFAATPSTFLTDEARSPSLRPGDPESCLNETDFTSQLRSLSEQSDQRYHIEECGGRTVE